jgi:hypothetical protein
LFIIPIPDILEIKLEEGIILPSEVDFVDNIPFEDGCDSSNNACREYI